MAQYPNNSNPNNNVPRSDNSGMGVILGILLAVLIVVGGYFFLKSEGTLPDNATTANIEAPDVTINTAEPAAGEPAGNTPAPAPAAQ